MKQLMSTQLLYKSKYHEMKFQIKSQDVAIRCVDMQYKQAITGSNQECN